MSDRSVRITLRDRQVSGGSIPSSALMGEPFVNSFNGVLFFSAVIGGDYETTSQTGIFEVGSKLYNQKITNRLNINDNFIISGDTGLISTYNGLSGAGLSGKFLSGTTAGFVVANISDIQGVQILVQNGTNIITGGTASYPTINLVASPSVNNITYSGTSTGGNSIATNVSATTFYSAATNLETIIYNVVASSGPHTAVQPGSNITTGGTAAAPVINLTASPSVNNITFSGTAIGGDIQAAGVTATSLSAGTLSGGTIYSGATNLQTIFNSINGQLTTKANLSGATFTGAISAPGVSDTTLTTGWAVYAGTSGAIKTNSGFTYDDVASKLTAQNLQVGSPTFTGTTTIWGDLVIVGDTISAFTSQLYIEDNNIIINYNPTANTTSTSLGAGLTVQDGTGVAGTDVFWDIRGTGTTADNRSFATNLADIRIRETGTSSSPNGVRVLAEFDILDAGDY